MSPRWPPEPEHLLTVLFAAGHSAGQIGERLRHEFADLTRCWPFTRNAVIGKQLRMGLHRTPEQIAVAQKLAYPKNRAPPKAAKPKPIFKLAGRGTVFEAAPIGPGPTGLPEHPGGLRIMDPDFKGCKWPIGGEGADTRFCCQPRDGHGPYCAAHHALGTTKTQTPRELMRSLRRHTG